MGEEETVKKLTEMVLLLAVVLAMVSSAFAQAPVVERIAAPLPAEMVAPPARGPYIQGIWTKGNPVYIGQGATFTPKLQYDQMFTNLAWLYHPLSAGSLTEYLPDAVRPFVPPESWACTIGGAYAGGNAGIETGCGVNLLDSVRGWASSALQRSNSGSLAAFGKQIAPGNGPVNLFASRVESIRVGGKAVPRWLFQASFGF